jgi:hypothetical protein
MAFRYLNTMQPFPKVIDDMILSYAADRTKPQWKSIFNETIAIVNEMNEDIDMMIRNRNVSQHRKKYYSIY